MMIKFGFHYFPDTKHYRQKDLDTWLPRLTELGASWLTLLGTSRRAIPETFLRKVLHAGIEPVIHMPLDLQDTPPREELKLLFSCYARWGVQYVILFERPNVRRVWGPTSWAEKGLVERFLDLYLPLADEAFRAGLKPVFPPLEPGGDYWDTSFLRAALEGLRRRASSGLLEQLVLSMDARANGHDLNWGAGGPENWPDARPYFTPLESQDQRGFRIGDWYRTISRAVLGKTLPMFMLYLGGDPAPEEEADRRDRRIAGLLTGKQVPGLEPLPEEVLGGMFWLLSADPDSEHESHAWYNPSGEKRALLSNLTQKPPEAKYLGDEAVLEHYLLLPTYNGTVTDWHLEVIRGFVKRRQPTVGFSLSEAARAKTVTVLGGEETFSPDELSGLREKGCVVRRITGDGTEIAAQLSRL